MTALVSLFVAGDPVAKGRPRVTVRNGRAWAYTPKKTASAEAAIRALAKIEMRGRKPSEEPVSFTYCATLPIPASWSKKKRDAAIAGKVRPIGRPDCDNLLKSALDACIGAVFRDDGQVVSLVAQKRYGTAPGVEIEVREVAA